MTTVDSQGAAPSRLVRAADVLASEWIKFRSIRSTYWTLLVAVVTALGLAGLVAFAFTQPTQGSTTVLTDPLLPGLLSLEYAVLAVGVLGVLAFGTERSSGLIRTTFCAVPRRRAVLAAKATVVGGATLLIGECVAVVSFLGAQAILARTHRGVSLAEPGALRGVLVEGLLLCVCALLGLGLGALVRHPAGALAALVGLLFLPAMVGLLPAPWNHRVGAFTLFYAAQQGTALHPRADLLSPGWCVLVLLAWPAAALLAAAVVIDRRDE